MKKYFAIGLIITVNAAIVPQLLKRDMPHMEYHIPEIYAQTETPEATELSDTTEQHGTLLPEDAQETAKKYLTEFFETDLEGYECTSTLNRDEYGIFMEYWTVSCQKGEIVYLADVDAHSGDILSLDVYDPQINKNSVPTETVNEEELENFKNISVCESDKMNDYRQAGAYRQYTKQPKGESIVTLLKFPQGDSCEVELSYPSGQKVGYKYYENRQTMNFKTKDAVKTLLKRSGYQCYWVTTPNLPKENVLENLKELNKTLNQKFDFIELCTQPIEYIGNYSGSVDFVDGGVHNINISDGTNLHTMLKTVQIGERLCDDMRLSLAEGKYIEHWDYNLKSGNDTINVILGYDYKPFYDVGDEIEAGYLNKTVTLKVIGFYEKGAVLYYGRRIALDKCIVMPFVNCDYEPTDENEKKFQINEYWQKNDGLIRINDDFDLEAAKVILNELSDKYNGEIRLLDCDICDIDIN